MTTITELANKSNYSFRTIKEEALCLLKENIQHFHGDYDQIRDTISEVIANVIPTYHQDVLACLLSDDLELDFSDSGLIPESKSLVSIMQARIHEQLSDELNNELDGLIEEWQGEQGEEEEGEATQWYCMSDEKTGPCVICYYDSLQEAIEAVDERFFTLGKPCHVEDDTSSVWLYTPKGHPDTQEDEDEAL